MISCPKRRRNGGIYFVFHMAKLSLNAVDFAHLDDEVDGLPESEEESQQAKLKSQWAALEKVVGAESHVTNVVADLLAHFA